MFQNTHGKTIRLLTVPFTLVLYSQRNAFVFSKQFWVAAAPFKHRSPSMLSVFTKYIPAFYGDMSLQKIHRYGTCSYLFVLICGRFRNHRALPPLPSEKLVQCSFWRFVDTRPIVRIVVTHALRWHSEKPTSVYSTTNNDKRRSYPDTLFSESMVSFADSPFKFLLLPPLPFLDPWRYVLHTMRPKRRV